MKRIISLLVVMAMMLASVLAIIPVAATTPVEDNDVVVENNAADDGAGDTATEETPAEVTRFLPDGVMDKIKAVFEADGAGTKKYEPKPTAPFVNNSEQAQKAFEGKRLLKIWAPIKKAAAVDANGDLHFTLGVATIADLKAAPVAEYSIKVNAEKYGITPNSDVNKVIEVNLYDYNIVVGEGQCLVIGGNDTAWLAWEGNQNGAINNILKADAPYAVEFSPNVGSNSYNVVHWGTSIFYDVAMIDADAEVPAEYIATPINTVEEFKAMESGKEYALNADLTLPADWAAMALSDVTLYGNGKTITLTGTNGLFGTVTNSTIRDLTLAGDVTATSGLINVASNVVIKNVTADLTALKNDGTIGVFVTEAKGDVTLDGVINKTDITNGYDKGIAGLIAKLTYGNIVVKNSINEGNISGNDAGLIGQANNKPADQVSTLTVENYTNKGYVKAARTAGGCGVGYNIGGNITAFSFKNVTNLGTVEAGWCGGLIGAQHNGATAEVPVIVNITNCVNGSKDDANLGKILGGGTAGGAYFGEAYSCAVTVEGGANYATIKGHNAGSINGRGAANLTVKNFNNYGTINGTLTGGGFAGWPSATTLYFENCSSTANVSAQYAGGLIGAAHCGNTTFKNVISGSKDVKYTAKGTSFAAGFSGEQNGNLTVINCTNYTVPNGGSGTKGAGFAGQFNSEGKVVFENSTNNANSECQGAWNAIGGGFIGTANNAAASFSFTDCVNNGNFNYDGNNFGGFLGGHQDCLAYKSISFVRCTNNGNITSTGNIGGFLGQGGGVSYYFEDCVNNGDIYSKSNLAGAFFGWGGGNGALTAIRCYNYGDISANKHPDQLNKKAAGFCAGRSVTVNMTDCVNFGNISSTEGDAAGLLIDVASANLVRCYNVGNVKAGVYNGTARVRYELSSGNVTLRDCMVTNFHADIIAKVKTLPVYAEIYDKTDYPALVAAVNAATAVYNKADATAEDKAAAIAAIDAAISDLTTWMEVSPDAAAIGGVINVTAESINAEGKDWIGLVKNGEDVATVWAYLTDVLAAENGFNILNGTYADGKELVEGEYTLYFVPNDATIAEILAGDVEALATKDIIISGKAITTPEQFIAMEETGDYILGCDITLPADYAAKTFKGTFDGRGHSITLTGTDGLFYKLDGATIKNLTLEATAKTRSGLTHLVAGTVNFNNVSVFATINTWWASSDYDGQVGGFVDKVNDAAVVLNFTDCTANVSVERISGNAGGFIGEVINVGQINMTNCVSATSKNAITILSNSNWQDGQAAGGFFGRIGNGTVTFTDCVNNAKVYGPSAQKDGATMRENAGGYIGIVAGGAKVNFIDCVNNGEIGTTASGRAGGFVGAYTSANTTSKVAFDGCLNTANITSANSAGGFIGYANGVVTATNCQNGAKKNDITIAGNGGSNDEGTAGFAGFLSGQITIYDNTEDGSGFGFKNYAYIKPNGNHSAAGVVALFANGSNGAANVFKGTEVYNYGDVKTWDGWHYGDGGIIANGKWRGDVEIYLTNVENHGNVLYSNNSNKGGIIGYTENGKIYSLINCKNYGNVNATGNAGGLLGQVRGVDNVYIENCENHGNITATLGAAGIFGGYASVDNSCIIKDTANYGIIQSTGNNAAAGFTVDLKGEGTKVYTNCVNYGTIISANTAASLIAWIGNKTTLENCDNEGQIISLNGKGYAFHDGAPTMDDACENNGYVIKSEDPSTFEPIWTAEDFMNMKPEGFYILMDNIVLPEDYKSIVFGTNLYTGGILEGNGKTIYMKGLTNALFFELYNATIRNFNVVGTLTFSGDGAALIQNLKCNKGATISGITLDVDVTANTAAGFVRWYDKNNKTTINITDCAYLGNITGNGYTSAIFGGGVNGTLNIENVVVGSKTEKTTITGKNRVGAFFSEPSGQGGAAAAKDNVINVTNCVNYADIKQISNGNEGCAGSLAGRFCYITVNVDGFTNYGDVDSKRTTTWEQGVGGIIGEINQNTYANLTHVVNYGDAYSNVKNVGGMVGLVSVRSYLVIRDSANFGNVSNGTGWQFSVGGFVGGASFTDGNVVADSPFNSIEIYNSENYGNVTSTGSNMGGFLGMTASNSVSKVVIDGCDNYGTISAANNCAGGILGQVGAESITVNNCNNYGTIKSQGGVGGIASYFWSGTPTTTVFTNNSNYGTLTSTGSEVSGIVIFADSKDEGSSKVSGNTNYGIIIAPAGKNACAITSNLNKVDEFLGNENYGIVASANGILSPAVTESETMTAVVNEGVILTDADLIAIAKALKPMWYYTEEDWFGAADVEPEAPEAPEVPESTEPTVEETAIAAPNNDGEEATETVEVLGILEALKAAQAVNDNVKAANALVETLTAEFEAAKADLTEAEEALAAAKEAVANASSEELEAATEALLEANTVYGAALLAKTEASTALVIATETAEDLTASQEEDRAAAVEALNTSVETAIDRTAYVELFFDLLKTDMEDTTLDNEALVEALTKIESAETQEEFDAAIGEVKDVIAAAIDYSALQAQWDRFMSIDVDDYTAASVRDVLEVIYKYSDLEEEDLTQAIVDEFAAELKAALDALRDNHFIIEDAIAFVESVKTLDPDDYTEPTWMIVDDCLFMLELAIEEENLEDIELYLEQTEWAIATILIEVGTLEDLLAEIETLDSANYTKFSWLAISSAVSKATAVLAAAEAETAEKELADANIAEAIAYVSAAIEGLVDISELKANVADAKAEAEGNYTIDTLAALNAAIAKAEIVLSTAKTAEEVAAANKALVAAIDALEERVDVNAGILANLIKAVEDLNAADYTAATWAAVKEALAAAKIAVHATTQAEVDAAFAALDAAKNALVTKPNTEALAGAIADVEALVAGDYTAETWAALVEALNAAKAALAADAQADVDAAKTALEAAKAALAAKVPVDNSALSALVAEIEALKSDDYTSDSWATVKAALDAAKAVLESDDQNEIDVAKATLEAAKAGLTKVKVEAPEDDKNDDEDEDETNKPATTEPTNEKKGCGSVIGATAVVLTAVLGLGATVVLKKKED